MARVGRPTDTLLKKLRELGLKYPGAHTKSPWPGHLDLAVNDKTFAYLSVEGEPFKISCKLPSSAAMALTLPDTEPTGYGLGKSGWVSARAPLPIEILEAWIDESYRAQAPKRLVKQLDAGKAAPAEAKPSAAGKSSLAQKAPAKKKTARA
jgi:predicted DNA-binding protein (MmcQ/YjbR family)